MTSLKAGELSTAQRRVWFLSALVVAIALRLLTLGSQSLENDELSTWRRASFDTPQQVIEQGVIPDVHPPGYQLLYYGVVQLFGESPLALRLPSVLFGVLTVVMMYVLGRRLYGPWTGLAGMSLMAVLMMPIFFSQQVRAYSLLVLLVLVAMLLWHRWFFDLKRSVRPDTGTVTGFVLVMIALSYVHYFGLFAVLLLGVVSGLGLLTKPKSWPTLALLFGLPALAYLPWLGVLLEHLRIDDTWIPRPGLLFLPNYLGYMYNKSFPLLITALIIYGGGAYALVRRWRRGEGAATWTRSDWVLLGWLAIPIAVAVAKSLVSTPVTTYRNLLICLPPLYLLLARAMQWIAPRLMIRNALLGGFLLLALGQLLLLADYYTTPQRHQFKQLAHHAAQILDREAATADSTLLLTTTWYPDYINYYLRRADSPHRVEAWAVEAEDLDTLAAKWRVEGAPQNILLLAAPETNFPNSDYRGSLAREGYEATDSASYYQARLWLLEVDEPAGGAVRAGGDRRN